MAFSYRWQDLIDALKVYTRNIPLTKIQAQQVDAVSSEMWRKFPWREACQTYPSILLEDGVQDYSSPPNFFKLVSGQITRTAPSADTYDPMTVVQALPVASPVTVDPAAIRSFAFEKGEGLIRLSLTPRVNYNEAYQIDGQYQQEHTRVTDLNTYCWFSDSIAHVAMEGIMYWGYKISDQFKMSGEQFKVFQSKMAEAWSQENQGHADILVPEITIGTWPNRGF